MTPQTPLAAELLLVLASAEADAAVYQAIHARGERIQYGTLEDHRTNVLGEVLAAIDRCQPGLGSRLQAAMYPTTSLEDA